MLPVSSKTALQALKLPVSWPYMMVLTNYGINMPGEGRQLSQRIGNVIKQGMFFFSEREIYSFERTVLKKHAVWRCREGRRGEGQGRQKPKS